MDDQHKNPLPPVERQTRRQFLKWTAGGALTTLWLTEGCRDSIPTPASVAAADSADNEVNTPEADLQEEANIYSTATPSSEGLRIAFARAPTVLDPVIVINNADIQAVITIYEGLTRVDADLTVQPLLAEEWTTSDDLLSWTFTLRQGVTFHHGTPFTARDVVYSFERILDPLIGSPLQSVMSFIATVTAIDDGTESGAVQFDLHTANADFPLLCGAPQAMIVAYDYDSAALLHTPSGTGTFRFLESIPDERTSFVRNELHWATDLPTMQEVHHLYLPSSTDRIEAMETGEVDMLIDLDSEDAALLARNETVTIVESPSGSYQTVVMQATEVPFNDLRIRQALKLCIDRKAIQQNALGGHGETGMDHPVASISPFHADLTVHEQDIELAKTLLVDAGYPDGITLDLITADATPGMVQLAHLVQEMAEPAGFTIRATEVPADVYWDSYWMQVPFHIGSWNFRASIDETFSLGFHSQSLWNESRWVNESFDALIEQARSEANVEQRKALYHQAQELIMEEGAVIIPFFRPALAAIQQRVKAFSPHPNGWLDLRSIELAE